MIAAVLAVGVVLIGAIRRTDVYTAFVQGAQEGMKTALQIVPYLCAALCMIGVLRGSGVMERLEQILQPFFSALGIPGELLPFLVMRPVSGSGALSALRDVIENLGVDSAAARLAAAMMGSSETVLYVLSVYLGAVKMRSARYCLWASLLSMLAGMTAVVWVMRGM